MERIRLETWIDAPAERCFLLYLSVDLHLASAAPSREQAIDGVTTGLIGEGETVTFVSRHLGVKLRHTSRVELLRPYSHFREAMVSGVFTRFEHDHYFAAMNDGTRVRDEIRFSVPFGALGRFGTRMCVRRRLTEFLTERNAVVKRVSESEEWHKYLDGRSMSPSAVPSGDETRSGWGGSGVLHGSQS
jgi:ligand-binding SRPBCC domain-containing protein